MGGGGVGVVVVVVVVFGGGRPGRAMIMLCGSVYGRRVRGEGSL